MKLTFDQAKIQLDNGVWLCLKVTEPAPARGFVHSMKDKKYMAELKEYRNHRSLDANAYFWVLASKLAEATGIPKTDIYLEAIRDIGGNTDVFSMEDAAVQKFCTIWSQRGIGWPTEKIDSKDGWTQILVYYGSSTYDTAQMSRLIDNIVQDCKSCGIETMTPRELDRLKEAWNAPAD